MISDAHVETWTDDLAGGILFQDDPYPAHAYNDRVQAQDRFLNLTYRAPSVIKTPDRLLRANAAVAMARGHTGGPQQIHHAHHGPHALTRGLSLGELSPRSPGGRAADLLEFDTKKVATHGTLKRLKLVKSPTDTQLFVPNQVQPPHIDPSNGNLFSLFFFFGLFTATWLKFLFAKYACIFMYLKEEEIPIKVQ